MGLDPLVSVVPNVVLGGPGARLFSVNWKLETVNWKLSTEKGP